MIRSVAVIGAGTAGREFARRCAEAGFAVTLEDVMPEKLRRAQDSFGAFPVRYASTVEEAVHDADIAVDFVPDELESKLEIFSLLDRMCPPRTLLLTPTYALSVTDLASCTYRREKCFGLRDTTLVRSAWSTDAFTQDVEAFLRGVGEVDAVVVDDSMPMLTKNV